MLMSNFILRVSKTGESLEILVFVTVLKRVKMKSGVQTSQMCLEAATNISRNNFKYLHFKSPKSVDEIGLQFFALQFKLVDIHLQQFIVCH